jgi:hypothetical protein
MSTSLELLLHSRLLRREQGREKLSTFREAWNGRSNSQALASPVAGRGTRLQEGPFLHPGILSPSSEGSLEGAPACAKWTHYGRWSHDGLKVLNERGDVIYELPAPRR